MTGKWRRASAAAGIAIAALFAAGLAAGPEATAEEASKIAIIVSERWVDLGEIPISDLRKIYLGKRGSLGGHRVEPWQRKLGAPIRAAFGEKVLGRSESELAEYWIGQALLGAARPPKACASFECMVEKIARRAGAIGYVDADRMRTESPPGVRVVAVQMGGKALLPEHAGYPLKY